MPDYIIYKIKDNKVVTRVSNIKQAIYFLNKHDRGTGTRKLWVKAESGGVIRPLDTTEHTLVEYGVCLG
jgi:hypothetical protein